MPNYVNIVILLLLYRPVPVSSLLADSIGNLAFNPLDLHYWGYKKVMIMIIREHIVHAWSKTIESKVWIYGLLLRYLVHISLTFFKIPKLCYCKLSVVMLRLVPKNLTGISL